MSKRIIKKLNKDIDQLYLHQKEEIKNLCHIHKKANSILKPSLLFIVVSLILCFHIYQIQQPIIQNPNQIEEPSTQENKKNSSKNNIYSPIAEDDTEEASKESLSTKRTVEEQLSTDEKTLIENKSSQYIGIYCLGLFDIIIVIYIFLKKTNKIS